MIFIKEKNFAWHIDNPKGKSIVEFIFIRDEIKMHAKQLIKEVE